MRLQQLTLGGLVTSSAVAVNLYVSSYSGTISTLQLSRNADYYSLSTLAVNSGSLTNPTFLTKAPEKGIFYCSDEDFSRVNGSIASYRASSSGELVQIDRHDTLNGPVHQVAFNRGKALAVAEYGGSGLQTFAIHPSGVLSLLQTFAFPVTSAQVPHPHEALIDPTDSFVVVPDLGSDLIRVFSIDPKTSSITPQTPYQAPSGSGPRHGAFLRNGAKTYFFLLSELANTVTSFNVIYGKTSLTFEEIFRSGTNGDAPVPAGSAGGEAILSPDNRFLLTSSRNATMFQLPNFDPKDPAKIPSDSLQSWEIDQATGKLNLKQVAPAGGRFPRQFSTNRNGTLAAVGLQKDSRVVIIERNVYDGTFGKFVAAIDVEGEITSVIWDE